MLAPGENLDRARALRPVHGVGRDIGDNARLEVEDEHLRGRAIASTAGEAVRQLVGNVDGLATLAAERAYISAFFDMSLRGKPQPLLAKARGLFAGVSPTVGR